MTTPATPAYDALTASFLRLHRLNHLESIVSWDQAVNMPAASNAARGEALAEMAALMHRLRTDPALAEGLQRAEQEPLDDDARANLREMRRQWRQSNALPEALVARRERAVSRCEHAWRTQRPANDWTGFAANFAEVLACAREEAARLSDLTGLTKYDALMDRYEPGMTSARLDGVFGELRSWLPDLIQRALARQADGPLITEPHGPFPVAGQQALAEAVVRLLGFDTEAGRLDTSTHPFTGGAPEDVRLTTRYDEQNFVPGLMGTIHETGHGRYEQNRPRALLGQPVSESRSMAIHESQSLAFEMQIGRHPAFVARIAPLVAQHLGRQPAFEPASLQRLLTRVRPGLIRVDADEVTYPAHVLLRHSIERPLIEGEIAIADIPALWDAGMAELLGLDTRGDFRNGAMQDVHWPTAGFGYFPCYTLGAMYAAQWFAAMRRELPDLDARIAAGDLAPVFGWLHDRIWSQGSRWTTDELTVRASGETLNPAHFRAHLERRYLG
jgi:carboxypeptidase Taq